MTRTLNAPPICGVNVARGGNVVMKKWEQKSSMRLNNFLRPTTPQTAWLCSMVDPSNGYTVLHLAALQGHAEVIKMLVDVDTNMLNARDRRGCLPVHLAAWNGHVEAVQVLIDAEPDSVDAVNNAKESPLHLSAQHGHGKVVTALLAKHADARLRNARAETALDIAARLGKANVCRLIICNCPELALQSAAECSSTDSGRSRHVAQVAYPLHAAARHGHIDCLHILCQSGFDLDYVTEEGSALHVAALFGKVEAVKLLLEQGISVETRDSQGRTVLETLREHESEKASDLTQVIQSREGWSECRKLIEGLHYNFTHVARLTASLTEHKSTTSHSCAMTTSNDSCGAYQNVAQCSKYKADSKDVVWRPIPEGSTVRRQCAHSPRHSRNVAVVSSNGIYHPPSLLADVVTLSSDGHEFDGVSTLSLSTTLPDPSEHDSSGQPSPSSSGMATVITNQIPRFPLTSPNNKGRHTSSNRSVNVQPRMGLARASLNSGLKAGCSYQAPHLYDAWCPHRVTGYDNVIPPPHPLMAYDNVPRNLLVYDNAPPPVKPTRARPALQANTFKPEPPSHLERSVDTTEESHDRVSTRSERANSTASVVTFACSTLERSVSPDGVNRTPSGTQSLAHGRAPLALPEDVCGSTSTSIMSTSMSPERCVTSDEKSSWRRSGTGTDENSASDKASSSTVGPSTSTQTTAVCMKFNGTTTDSMKSSVEVSVEAPSSSRERGAIDIDVGDLPSPETTKSRIHEFLCSHEELKKRLSLSPSSSKAQQTKTDALSPSTTDCSDCTLASSCSLPIISQISSTPPSVVSPTRERSQVSKQCSTEDPSLCSVEVRLRTQPIHLDVAAHRGAVFHVKNNHRTSSEGCCHSDMSGFAGRTERLKGSMQRASSNDVGDERQHTSLNESIEWKKINEIMESFGGAICRESVFADQYEPRVAVYLRDRRSQALTLQLSGPQPYQQAQHQAQRFQACGAAATVAAADRCSRRSPTTTAVADWLNVSVGIPNPRAKEIAAILESHGFDNVDHMQSTLDRLAMHEIGLDKSTQHQIGTYLDNYPGQRNASANTFTYVSDWLHSLDLEDYLGHFMNGGLTSMLIVSALDPSSKHLKSLGITSLGHQRRILNSLKEAKIERRQRAAEKVNAAMHDDETDSGQESRSTAQSSSASTQKPHSIIVGGRQTEWRHSSTTLIEDCVSYSAHYLGSMEISNIEGTEDSRRAMIKLKKGIREIAKVPQVLLEISVAGVRVLDATTKQLTVEHEITRIQIVCQDERDLNCFAYISQDGDKHFCHVFCVLTADVATEIIITLGQAFEVCYRIANGTYGGPEPIVINPVS
ncbi:Ankyrin repeat and sterile alpha motif domain-containing protein 1B [Toxocara canis]|uniref:Ankyrin repeat and sterile alpha motif domain-containing protein 1B n=1 Tax=Toxocara canis TaxID=6265 RepID=A0A0B2V860_TOXCA|nr:Ankyrin repeat and sterile alpha motif domain-containing protein 1B [Toxocara canis]